MRQGDLLEQRYRLVRVIGRGRSGVVWCARNELIDRAVAVKVFDPSVASEPDQLSRFFQEARACGRIRHPAVVEVLDLGQADNGGLFLVMELLDGETLSTLLSRKGRLSTDEALALFVPLCRGLAAAHAQGIVHRDLKPANVYLHKTAAGGLQPKLLDFGISKFIGNDTTHSGLVVGTPSYMSPEQVRGLELDGRSDLWSLGVMLFEVLAGRLPFASRIYQPLVEEILEHAAPRIESLVADLPSDLPKTVHELLEKNRDRRTSSATAVAQRWTAILAARGQEALLKSPEEDLAEGAPTLAQERDRLRAQAAETNAGAGGFPRPGAIGAAASIPNKAVSRLPAPAPLPAALLGAGASPSAATTALAMQTGGAKRVETNAPRPAAGVPATPNLKAPRPATLVGIAPVDFSRMQQPKPASLPPPPPRRQSTRPPSLPPPPPAHRVSPANKVTELGMGIIAHPLAKPAQTPAKLTSGEIVRPIVTHADFDPEGPTLPRAKAVSQPTAVKSASSTSSFSDSPAQNAHTLAGETTGEGQVTTGSWELSAGRAASGRAEVILGASESRISPAKASIFDEDDDSDWEVTRAESSAVRPDGTSPELADGSLPKLLAGPVKVGGSPQQPTPQATSDSFFPREAADVAHAMAIPAPAPLPKPLIDLEPVSGRTLRPGMLQASQVAAVPVKSQEPTRPTFVKTLPPPPPTRPVALAPPKPSVAPPKPSVAPPPRPSTRVAAAQAHPAARSQRPPPPPPRPASAAPIAVSSVPLQSQLQSHEGAGGYDPQRALASFAPTPTPGPVASKTHSNPSQSADATDAFELLHKGALTDLRAEDGAGLSGHALPIRGEGETTRRRTYEPTRRIRLPAITPKLSPIFIGSVGTLFVLGLILGGFASRGHKAPTRAFLTSQALIVLWHVSDDELRAEGEEDERMARVRSEKRADEKRADERRAEEKREAVAKAKASAEAAPVPSPTPETSASGKMDPPKVDPPKVDPPKVAPKPAPKPVVGSKPPPSTKPPAPKPVPTAKPAPTAKPKKDWMDKKF